MRLPVSPADHGLPPGTYEISQARAGAHRGLGVFSGRHEVELRLAPKDIVLVTATRTAG